MSLDPDIIEGLVLLLAAMVVLHVSEMTVALLIVAVLLEEEVLWRFQDDGNQHEEFPDYVVGYVPCKSLDLVAVLDDDFWMRAVIRWDKFVDVVDFCIILDAGTDFLDSKLME